MAGDLNVDTGGLHAGAASSETAAAELVSNTPADLTTSTQQSAGGVAAVNDSLTALQGRQSVRITGQARDMSTGAAAYGRTDADGSDTINTVQV